MKKNVTTLTERNRSLLHFGDGISWLRQHSFHDERCLFLIDPPYQSGLFADVIQILSTKSGIAAGSLLVIESDKQVEFNYPGRFELIRQKTFNKTRLDILEFV